MSIFGKKDKAGNISTNFAFFDGIPSIQKGLAVNATLNDSAQRVELKLRLSKMDPFYIRYEQICGVAIVTEKEVIEANKSVVGRAVVGGVLLGPLGAVVGGISGVGSKKETVNRGYLVINYHQTDSPEDTRVVSLEIVGATLGIDKFVKILKEKCAIQEPRTNGGYL